MVTVRYPGRRGSIVLSLPPPSRRSTPTTQGCSKSLMLAVLPQSSWPPSMQFTASTDRSLHRR